MMPAEILRFAAGALALLLGLCYAYQIMYLLIPLFQKKPCADTTCLHRYAILIAARNEEAVLPHLLDSICNQDYPAELLQVFVVADNCTDNTAMVAQRGGALVFSRFSTHRVGKGYALQFLLAQIDATCGLDSFDAFLVFDADNVLCPDFITQINKVSAAGYDVFCGYRNSKNFGTNWVSAGHAMWFLHNCVHLNASRMALGTPCTVNGTGFGFTRSLLGACGGWNFFTLTEDIEFSFWCITHGIRVGYSRDAMFFDEQPETFRQSWRQRTRWAQGNVQVSVRYGRDLLRGMFRGGRRGYACMEAMTLSMWGCCVALLSGALSSVATLMSGGIPALLDRMLLTVFCSCGLSLLMGVTTLLLSWKRIHATTAQKLMGLLAFPLYTMTYVPIAVTALFRKFEWVPIEHKVALSVRELTR